MKLAVKNWRTAKPGKAPKLIKRDRTESGNRIGRARSRLATMAYLSPSLLGVMIFFVIPFGIIIFYALVDNPVNKEFVFLDNFMNVINNSAFRQAAATSAKFTVIAVPLAVVLSLLLAMMLEAKIPGKSRFRTFFLSPMMVPVASVVLVWKVLFHYNGAANEFIAMFGAAPLDWMNSKYSVIVIVLLFLWKNLGYNMILFMSAISNIPKEQVEAAAVDGAGPIKQFWHVKFRYLSPSILFVTILSVINSFKVFREVYLLTTDYPYNLYMLQHFMNNTFRSLDYQKLSAAAILMSIVMVTIIGILFIIENRFGRDVEQ